MFSKVRIWMNRAAKAGRVNYALAFSILVLFIAFGVASANGPMRPPGPPPMGGMGGGMWGRPMPMPWMPMEPVPTISIIGVVQDQSVTFETADFPADQDFTVTMGPIYSRGVNGYEVGSFNSGDGSAQQLSFPIPSELAGQYRIAVRAQTSHAWPYFAFNWFFNTTAGDTTAAPAAVEAPAAEAETPAVETPVAETPATEPETGTGGAEAATPSLTGVTWYWTNFTDPEQGALPIAAPENYTIEFTEEGRVAIKADCNNGNGTYIVDAESIDIAIGAMTLALCEPESLSDQYVNYLGEVASFTFDGADLLLDLPVDAGTLRFSTEPTAAAVETPPAAETAPTEASLTGVVWEWASFVDPVAEPLSIADPAQYTIEFMEDGTAAIKADCNNASAAYTADAGTISITVGAMTRALCAPESYSDKFIEYLGAAAVYSFEGADLLLDLPVDSGTMRFMSTPLTAEATTAVAAVSTLQTVASVSDSAVQTVAAVAEPVAETMEETVPSFKICSVVKDETVTIVTSDFPAGETFAVKMGPMPAPQPMPMGPMGGPWQQGPMMPPMGGPMMPPMGPEPMMGSPRMGAPMPMQPSQMWGRPQTWIPYYEAGTLESGDGGELTATFDIPAELAGYYRISIVLRTEHQYPYLAYNWFYNNTADVCNDVD